MVENKGEGTKHTLSLFPYERSPLFVVNSPELAMISGQPDQANMNKL